MNKYTSFLKEVREAWQPIAPKVTNYVEWAVDVNMYYNGQEYRIVIDDLVFTTVDGIKQSEVGHLILAADYLTREYLIDLGFKQG